MGGPTLPDTYGSGCHCGEGPHHAWCPYSKQYKKFSKLSAEDQAAYQRAQLDEIHNGWRKKGFFSRLFG